jgi:serine/threonine-protein kinase
VWLASLAALVAGLGAAAFLLVPSGRGALTVTVGGPNNELIPQVQILADEASRCTSSPCKLDALASGTHFVRVNAPGYEPTAPRAVTVSSDGEATVHIQLSKLGASEAKRAPAPAAPEPALGVDELPTTQAAAPSRAAGESEVATRRPQVAAKLLAASGVQAAAATDAQRTASAGESGVLNINSTPVANVVLDGRPIGQTPLLGVEVAAGTHTIVFVDPAGGGRVVRSAAVEGGTTRTVTARLADGAQ